MEPNNIQEAIKLNSNQRIKQVICAVYDSKVMQYTPPVFCRTLEEAIRSFGAGAKKEGHEFKEYAADFTLWQIGYFYPETGKLESIERIQISSATEF